MPREVDTHTTGRTPGAAADKKKPRCARLSQCAREDSNFHGPYGPQGPQPCTPRVDASRGVQSVGADPLPSRVARSAAVDVIVRVADAGRSRCRSCLPASESSPRCSQTGASSDASPGGVRWEVRSARRPLCSWDGFPMRRRDPSPRRRPSPGPPSPQAGAPRSDEGGSPMSLGCGSSRRQADRQRRAGRDRRPRGGRSQLPAADRLEREQQDRVAAGLQDAAIAGAARVCARQARPPAGDDSPPSRPVSGAAARADGDRLPDGLPADARRAAPTTCGHAPARGERRHTLRINVDAGPLLRALDELSKHTRAQAADRHRARDLQRYPAWWLRPGRRADRGVEDPARRARSAEAQRASLLRRARRREPATSRRARRRRSSRRTT